MAKFATQLGIHSAAKRKVAEKKDALDLTRIGTFLWSQRFYLIKT